LLRINYTPGDSYTQFIETSQNSGLQIAVKTSIKTNMKVTEVKDEIINTESQITSIAMNGMQGGMSLSYDSNANEETLDQMGKMLQSQFKPMMDAKIMSSTDKMGNVIDMSIEPMIPGMDNLTKNSGIAYPEEAVKVGSAWSSTIEEQGVTMASTYSVSDIANGFVYLDISGEITGLAEGTISGTAEIEVSSGALKVMEMQTSMDAQNMTLKGTTKVTMTKN
jgi:hypothetical protein